MVPDPGMLREWDEEGEGSGAGGWKHHSIVPFRSPPYPVRWVHGAMGFPPMSRVRPPPTDAAEEQPRSRHLTRQVSWQEPIRHWPSVGARHCIPCSMAAGLAALPRKACWAAPPAPLRAEPPKVPQLPSLSLSPFHHSPSQLLYCSPSP